MSNKTQPGILYLIPVLLGDDSEVTDVLPAKTIEITSGLSHFISENAKSARQFLKKLPLSRPLQEITISEIDKHSDKIDFDHHFAALRSGENTGLLSEAGMPAVADPGSQFVIRAHKEGIRVVPLTGPSSILLALAASGFKRTKFCVSRIFVERKAAKKRSDQIARKKCQVFKSDSDFY